MDAHTTVIEKAREIGAAHREDFRAEFGAYPVFNEVGDWDSAGWSGCWEEIEQHVEFSSPEIQTEACRAAHDAYTNALFNTTEELC